MERCAAVGIAFEADGRTVQDVRVALGGVATKPWRAPRLRPPGACPEGQPRRIARASRLAVEGAVDRGANRFKIDLAPRVVARAILSLGEKA